uniref:Uncharacterized protein n=1 Tax=Neobodo designis TaxID=312471 RepID=A0A7S1M4Z0_NEODS|mmetsp:Transcript_34053/g.105164  ORF Transcript_34053/g.105164 Transcript_34053/m.105164 type:complete len:356 (+) Transcript_34053:63-1130(+)|eukprot:CAMPEP_0174850882 /NCGR_PEP_ID=MMETSP1114-20130205/21191_1 /TAXON_ID=312471 /ORGANISM="Neobodo designis, Strain CCAP 1951/1" /LENGTH=355 /DNA_ID=CAMNT_0016085373 /DNA_START=62 /DNA_END=1129 /DNA_ORIENTATION=-
MLRRGRCPTIVVTRAAMPALCARRGVSAEEQAEIEREAKLRQEFMKKKMQQAQNGSFFQRVQAQAELAQAQMNAMKQQQAQQQGGAGGAPGGNPWGAGGPPQMRAFSLGAMMWTAFLWSMALYLILAVWQMRKPQAATMAWQGAPQWAIAPESTAAFFAVRTLLSSSRQRELQSEYEEFSKMNPTISFYTWLTMYKPNVLAGNNVSQAEFLAALSNVARATGDGAWTKVFTRISRWGDEKSHVDAVMDKLRSEYSQYIAAPVPAGMGHTPGYGMNMPSGHQAYGYGSNTSPSYNYGSYQQPQQQQQWGQQQQQWNQQPQWSQSQQQQQQPTEQDGGDSANRSDSGNGGSSNSPTA